MKLLSYGRIAAVLIVASSTLGASASLHAQSAGQQTSAIVVTSDEERSNDVSVATSSSKQATASSPKTVTDLWQAWLNANGMSEGINSQPDGRVIVLQSGQAAVRANPGDAKWLTARNAAFQEAELAAKKDLAEFLKADVTSDRSAMLSTQGGEAPPPMFQQPAEQLSIMDKSRVLAGAALDDTIKKFEPKWDGTGRTEAQKKQELITLEEKVKDHIASRASLYMSGAFVVTQFEGPDQDHKNSVLVGLIWSQRLGKIAEAVMDPAVQLAPEDPEPAVSEQIAALTRADSAWLASAAGVRIWTNEQGRKVVIGFGSAPATSSATIDRDRATLSARAAIQRFVGELIETAAESKNDFAYQESANGEAKSFDESLYHRNIEARAATISLSGSIAVAQWRDKHPIGNVPMQVVVVSWTPASFAAARLLGAQMDQQQRNVQAGSAPAPAALGNLGGVGSAPVGGPARQGPSSNPTKF